ncbi:MAG: HDIG domain-containing protein [Treponema sp.]|nr:HDIG domain-containing protein [Treponema sp.]
MKNKAMKNKNVDDKPNPCKEFLKLTGDYVSKKYPFILLFLAVFVVVSVINFIDVSTRDTVSTYSLTDFEVGQIADRTIVADKSIEADELEGDKIFIQEGEKIIKKGFPITEEAYAKLEKMAASPMYIDYRTFADLELYCLLLAVLWYLLFTFIPQPYNKKLTLKEPLTQVVCFLIVYSLTVFCGKLNFFADPYLICIIIPASFFVLLITILFGQNSAVLLSFVMSLGVLCGTHWALVPFLFTLATSLSALAVVRKINHRLDLVFASIIQAIFNIVLIMLLTVIFNDRFDNILKLLIGLFTNGFLSGVLALGLLTPLEYLLNTASVFRLMDLSDLNNALMRRMLVTASGTYNHSLMVAQLAESACREIGANALIARVGGYYHDIGKIDQSEYFVENQQGGPNKHNDLNPTLSSTIIRSHVKKGVEKARQMHMPQAVIDIIAEHHGNSVIAYFYNEAKEKDPTLSPEDFAYPGNPPSTKESAVVMLADTVEAACHTLENPSVSRLEKFINTLVNGKIEHHQLDNCDLTYRDITKIKEAFVQVLAGYYHSRIEYPDQKDPEKK